MPVKKAGSEGKNVGGSSDLTDLEGLRGQEVEHTSLGKTIDRSDLYLLKNSDKK